MTVKPQTTTYFSTTICTTESWDILTKYNDAVFSDDDTLIQYSDILQGLRLVQASPTGHWPGHESRKQSQKSAFVKKEWKKMICFIYIPFSYVKI